MTYRRLRRMEDLPSRTRERIARAYAVLCGANATAQELAEASATVESPRVRVQTVIDFPRTPSGQDEARACNKSSAYAGKKGTG
jgi:hypothetical protein